MMKGSQNHRYKPLGKLSAMPRFDSFAVPPLMDGGHAKADPVSHLLGLRVFFILANPRSYPLSVGSEESQ
jgi:hypothetical protein